MWFVVLVTYGESRYRRRPICHAEPCCHATGVWLLLYDVFLCVFSVLCFIRELKIYWIIHNKCIVWSLLLPWYCINRKKEEKRKDTFKNLTCWPSPVKIFSNVTIRNLSRIKMLPFSCTKEKFMKTSEVRNVILCLYLWNGPDDLWEICWFTLDQVCKDILKMKDCIWSIRNWWFESLSMVSLPLYYKALVCSLCSSSISSCNVLWT